MPLYDITVPLSAKTPTYPGDPQIEIHEWRSLAKGDTANVSLLHFGAHSATHVDAPAHFIEGAARVESLSLEVLIGEAQVVEVPFDCEVIDKAFVVKNVSPETTRVLFKTRNSSFWRDKLKDFQTHFTHVESNAARKLVELGVKLVGIDYLSVEKFHSEKHETHHALLSKEVIILEGLNLTDVSPGRYELICLPLKVADGSGDGAPARAVLREL
ncbi:MAG: cyclase family protein [Pyrinomonadaceae bacterium]